MESDCGSLSSKLILAQKRLLEMACGPAASRARGHAVLLHDVGLRNSILSEMVELMAAFAMNRHHYHHHTRSPADCSRLAAAPEFSIGPPAPKHPTTATALDGSSVGTALRFPPNQARLWLMRLGLALSRAVPALLRGLRFAGVRCAVPILAWLGSVAAVGTSAVHAHSVGS